MDGNPRDRESRSLLKGEKVRGSGKSIKIIVKKE